MLEDLERGDKPGTLKTNCLPFPGRMTSQSPEAGQFAGVWSSSSTLFLGDSSLPPPPAPPRPLPFPVPSPVEGGWRMSELVLPHSPETVKGQEQCLGRPLAPTPSQWPGPARGPPLLVRPSLYLLGVGGGLSQQRVLLPLFEGCVFLGGGHAKVSRQGTLFQGLLGFKMILDLFLAGETEAGKGESLGADPSCQKREEAGIGCSRPLWLGQPWGSCREDVRWKITRYSSFSPNLTNIC